MALRLASNITSVYFIPYVFMYVITSDMSLGEYQSPPAVLQDLVVIDRQL